MRQGFIDITSGWTLVSGFDAITERIERAAEWTEANGPLRPDEEATVKLMIETQIALGYEDADLFDADDNRYKWPEGRRQGLRRGVLEYQWRIHGWKRSASSIG